MRISEMRPGDVHAVRRALRRSLTPLRAAATGAPAPELLDAYEALCLDWFLHSQSPGRVGLLHDDQGSLCG